MLKCQQKAQKTGSAPDFSISNLNLEAGWRDGFGPHLSAMRPVPMQSPHAFEAAKLPIGKSVYANSGDVAKDLGFPFGKSPKKVRPLKSPTGFEAC
jgi:hypothetical protein